MAPVAARAFGCFRIALCIPDAVNARPVLVELVDWKRRIVRTHESGVCMAFRTGGDDIERIDGRRRRVDVGHAVRVMARRALNNPLIA